MYCPRQHSWSSLFPYSFIPFYEISRAESSEVTGIKPITLCHESPTVRHSPLTRAGAVANVQLRLTKAWFVQEFDEISEAAKDFITSTVVKKKEDRLSADQCLDHPWLKR